jgi:predicted kinase
MNKLILIIGWPGSGKSTMAEKIKKERPEFADANIWEADMFFVNPKNGKYNWNFENLASAHKWCQIQTENDMRDGNNVIVSNTSLRPRERKPYLLLAKKYNYEVEVITCTGEYKNIHNVPEEKVNQMKAKFIPYSENEIKNL